MSFIDEYSMDSEYTPGGNECHQGRRRRSRASQGSCSRERDGGTCRDKHPGEAAIEVSVPILRPFLNVSISSLRE